MNVRLQPNRFPQAVSTRRFSLQGSTLAIVLFIVFAIVVSVRGEEPSTNRSYSTAGNGNLLVYSATDRFNDGDTLYYVHSSYVIYTVGGKFVKNVTNHISTSDEVPELVTLPAGRYVIDVRSEEKGYIRADIIIRPGRTTVIDLESSQEAVKGLTYRVASAGHGNDDHAQLSRRSLLRTRMFVLLILCV